MGDGVHAFSRLTSDSYYALVVLYPPFSSTCVCVRVCVSACVRAQVCSSESPNM